MAADPMEELAVAFDAMATDMAVEDFNAESTHIEHDLAQDDVRCGPNGELVQVHTSWAMGFVDEQGVSLI